MLTPFQEQRVVGNFLRQGVLEGVLDIASRRLLVDEFSQLEIVKHAFQFLARRRRNYLGNESKREVAAKNCKRLKQILLTRGKAIDTSREERLNGRRDAKLAQRLGKLDSRPLSRQCAFIQQHLHRLFHEEWIALGAFDDERLERLEVGRVAQQLRQHFNRALLRERLESYLS